jgi:hypothetical protein
LYQFGSKILGYDIYNRKLIDSPYKDNVGGGSVYGFHLTIADVLYYLSEAELKEMEKEIQFLAKFFKSFKLSGLKITKNFPDQDSISITVEDSTGNLEILHTEVVTRIYKKAIASNYTLGLASLNRNQKFSEERAESMLKFFKAPYILTQYKPHFTLLTKIPPGRQQDRIYKELVQAFDDIEKSISINFLSIMQFDKRENRWIIKGEPIPLR